MEQTAENNLEGSQRRLLFSFKVQLKSCLCLKTLSYGIRVKLDSNVILTYQKQSTVALEFQRGISNYYSLFEYQVVEIVQQGSDTGSVDREEIIYQSRDPLVINKNPGSSINSFNVQTSLAKTSQTDWLSMIHIMPIQEAQLDQHFQINLECLAVSHEVRFFLSNTKGKFECCIGA